MISLSSSMTLAVCIGALLLGGCREAEPVSVAKTERTREQGQASSGRPWYMDEPSYSQAYGNTDGDLMNFELAKTKARSEGKHVLLLVGGDWCKWCKIMDLYLTENADVADKLTESFVIQKVYIGNDFAESALLKTLPSVPGAPHFFVMSPSGALVASYGTAPLEDGGSYSKERFLTFASSYMNH